MIRKTDLENLQKALKNCFPRIEELARDYERLKKENRDFHKRVRKELAKGARKTDGLHI